MRNRVPVIVSLIFLNVKPEPDFSESGIHTLGLCCVVVRRRRGSSPNYFGISCSIDTTMHACRSLCVWWRLRPDCGRTGDPDVFQELLQWADAVVATRPSWPWVRPTVTFPVAGGGDMTVVWRTTRSSTWLAHGTSTARSPYAIQVNRSRDQLYLPRESSITLIERQLRFTE